MSSRQCNKVDRSTISRNFVLKERYSFDKSVATHVFTLQQPSVEESIQLSYQTSLNVNSLIFIILLILLYFIKFKFL